MTNAETGQTISFENSRTIATITVMLQNKEYEKDWKYTKGCSVLHRTYLHLRSTYYIQIHLSNNNSSSTIIMIANKSVDQKYRTTQHKRKFVLKNITSEEDSRGTIQSESRKNNMIIYINLKVCSLITCELMYQFEGILCHFLSFSTEERIAYKNFVYDSLIFF